MSGVVPGARARAQARAVCAARAVGMCIWRASVRAGCRTPGLTTVRVRMPIPATTYPGHHISEGTLEQVIDKVTEKVQQDILHRNGMVVETNDVLSACTQSQSNVQS